MQSKNTFFSKKTTINCGGELIDLSRPQIMGILNITPDSFYDGGKYKNETDILQQVDKMLTEGATFIDIGAYSSRPGAKHINQEEELKRLTSVIPLLKNKFKDIHISVDTFRSEVAETAVLDLGVELINDISAGGMDKQMFDTIAKLDVPYIMMHMQGTPQNMQDNPKYDEIIKDIIDFFHPKVQQLKQKGVADIIIDPGFGFGKTLEHNYELLSKLDTLKIFELPMLVGASRKSMIHHLLKNTPEEALNGTTVVNSIALSKGANILRVHDVKEAVETVKIVNELLKH